LAKSFATSNQINSESIEVFILYSLHCASMSFMDKLLTCVKFISVMSYHNSLKRFYDK